MRVGRRAAAFIATRLGIGLDYARKRHAHEPVEEFWLSVARMVIDQMARQAAPPVRRGPAGCSEGRQLDQYRGIADTGQKRP